MNNNIREFYEKNRQKILIAFVCFAGVFFLFYWTDRIITSKATAYESDARQSYERLEKAVNLAVQVRQAESTKRGMNEGLLSFIQKECGSMGIGEKLVNLRPITSTSNIEHISMRLENLYYDEFIKFIASIENFDNLRVKTVSFTRRYDNPQMIDVVFEIVKS